MARRPDGNPERAGRVSFTEEAARRIARAVRAHEQGNRNSRPAVSYPRMAGGGGGGSSLTFASFAGAWRKDYGFNLKTVTLLSANTNAEEGDPIFLPQLDGSGNPVQVTAINVLAHIPAVNEQVQKYCMVQKLGTIPTIPADPLYILVSGEC